MSIHICVFIQNTYRYIDYTYMIHINTHIYIDILNNHSLTHPPTHSLTHSIIHSITPSLSHSLTHICNDIQYKNIYIIYTYIHVYRNYWLIYISGYIYLTLAFSLSLYIYIYLDKLLFAIYICPWSDDTYYTYLHICIHNMYTDVVCIN